MSNQRSSLSRFNVKFFYSTDILRCGIVLTVVAGNIASMSSNTALVLYFRPRFTNILRWSGAIILFLTTWLFACLVAFDVIARNRQAKVTATLAGVPLPASIVAAQQSALGVSPVYWDQDYRMSSRSKINLNFFT